MKYLQLLFIPLFLSIPINAFADYVEPGGLHNMSRKSFTPPNKMKFEYILDQKEMDRTWDKAIVWVPTGSNKSKKTTVKRLIREYGKSDKKFPTAIYMHGCTGLWSGSSLRMKFLADNGFLVFGPASLARKKYAQSCDHTQHKGGMYREVLALRQTDAGNAIEKAKSLPFVDEKNMLLIGLSEGGITTATFIATKDIQTVNARVVEGWTCTSGWPEQAGVNAPDSEPVLSLVGVGDPWFQAKYLKGHCGTYMNKENGSKSVVYKTGKLAKRHELINFKSVQNEVMAFVKQHIELPLNVRDVQQILTNQGFDPGPVDGAWGKKTLNALNGLRAKHGLKAVKKLEDSSLSLLSKLDNS